MSQYKEVIVQDVEARDNSIIAVFILTVIAIVVVVAAWWQPWNAATPTNSTTIIRENTPVQTKGDTVYVPTPSAPGDTNINIKTETPPAKTEAPPVNSNEGTTSNEAGSDTAGGG